MAIKLWDVWIEDTMPWPERKKSEQPSQAFTAYVAAETADEALEFVKNEFGTERIARGFSIDIECDDCRSDKGIVATKPEKQYD